MRHSFSRILLVVILLVTSSALASTVGPVKAAGSIYIRADGSIDPSSAPIKRTGNLCTLTGNIVTDDGDGITIQRDSIILDGAGHTLKGC